MLALIRLPQSNKGFLAIEPLMALAMLLIGVLIFLSAIWAFGVQKKKSSEAIAREAYAASVRQQLSKKSTCNITLTPGQMAVVGSPASLVLNEAQLHAAPESFVVSGPPWVLRGRGPSGGNLLGTELTIEFAEFNRKMFLGPLFIEVDAASRIVNCFSELTSGERCEMMGGVYLLSTGQCSLSPAACPAGQFLVSSGPGSWTCR